MESAEIFFSHLCLSAGSESRDHEVNMNENSAMRRQVGLKQISPFWAESLSIGKEHVSTSTNNPPFPLAHITSHNCFVMYHFGWLPFRFSGLRYRAAGFHQPLVEVTGNSIALENAWWGASVTGNTLGWTAKNMAARKKSNLLGIQSMRSRPWNQRRKGL